MQSEAAAVHSHLGELKHGSVARPDGAVYMIRPEGGHTARTTFLDPADHPHPAPSFTPEDS